MIWLNILVPVVVVLYLVFAKHEHMAWWEYFTQFFIPVLVILAAHAIAVNSMTQDKEYWNNYAVGAQYDEPWDEYIHRTCTRENCSGSGKNRSCTTESYDCSYIDRHSARWRFITNGGGSMGTSKTNFNMAVSLWGNKTFVDMRRDYHTYDGDRYVTKWPGGTNRKEVIPVTTTHTYENRIQVPNEVLSYDDVDSTDLANYGIHDYVWGYNTVAFKPIMGDNSKKAMDTLVVANAKWGSAKQLHMMLLVFNDKPSLAGSLQEAHWKGGNKNEFVVCVGKKGGDIAWVKVFSWTTNEILKVAVRDKIMALGKYDVVKIADIIATDVPPKFVRREFKEFSYIKVEPGTTAVIVTFVIVLILSLLLAYMHVFNNFTLRRPRG